MKTNKPQLKYEKKPQPKIIAELVKNMRPALTSLSKK
jgi:hypothetical protein